MQQIRGPGQRLKAESCVWTSIIGFRAIWSLSSLYPSIDDKGTVTNQKKRGNDETLLYMISSEIEEELVYVISGNVVIKLRHSLIWIAFVELDNFHAIMK